MFLESLRAILEQRKVLKVDKIYKNLTRNFWTSSRPLIIQGFVGPKNLSWEMKTVKFS